jgi:GNAT superfamily N-acetyltransferase
MVVKIYEIKRIKPGAHGLGDPKAKLATAPFPIDKAGKLQGKWKPLLGVDSKYIYTIVKTLDDWSGSDSGLGVKVIDSTDNSRVASLKLSLDYDDEDDWDGIAPDNIRKKFVSGTVVVDPDHQGQGIGSAMYAAAIMDRGIVIRADNRQTPGGSRLWTTLAQNPNLEVFGVVIQNSYNEFLDNNIRKALDQKLRTMGLSFMGHYENDVFYWSFPVSRKVTNAELHSAIKGIKIYGSSNINVDDTKISLSSGLIARAKS